MNKIIAAYIKLHLKSLVMFIVFTGIFTFIFYLNEVPTKISGYAAIICLFIAVVFSSSDFYRFYFRHKCLTEIRNQVTIHIDNLPPPENIIEDDYTKLIRIIHEDKISVISEYSVSKQNMTDYYTMWMHQIKTPIAAMRLLLQTDSSANPELEQELYKIEQYVEMVLSYVRIDNSANDFVIRHQSIDNIIKQAVRKYAKLFIKKKIKLEFTESDITVLTDEKWLLFVIEQILSNSLKYTYKGKISVYTVPDKTLVIEDTGIGIAAEDLPRVFEKGFTGYNGRIDKKSTGIGLYLCSKILKKLGHSVSIYSDVNSGTKVMIDLSSKDTITE